MKKLLTLVVCSLLAICTVNAKDIASGTFKNGGTWKISDQGELYIDATTVPDYTNSIFTPWYEYREQIKTLRFSSKIKTIGKEAFASMYASERIVHDNSYEFVRYGLRFVEFDKKSSKDVVIKEKAFKSCGELAFFDFSYVSTIGDSAFLGCKQLSNITLPAVTSIGNNAFAKCLRMFTKEDAPTIYISASSKPTIGDLSVADPADAAKRAIIVVPPTVYSQYPSSIWVSDIVHPKGRVYPGYYERTNNSNHGNNGYGASTGVATEVWWYVSGSHLYVNYEYGIPDFASPSDAPWYAYRDQIKTVTLNMLKNYAVVGKNAFAGFTQLNKINNSDKIIEIHEAAFKGCTALEGKWYFPNLKSVGKEAFANCTAIKEISLPSVATIEEKAFKGCTAIWEIKLGEFITSIGSEAFANTLQQSTIPTYGTHVNHEIFMESEAPATAADAFSGVYFAKTYLNVASEYATSYLSSNVWNQFAISSSVLFPVSGTIVGGYGTWSIDKYGVLIINGGTPNYDSPSDVPWNIYRKYIYDIHMTDNCAYIGKNTFAYEDEGESKVTSVEIPATVETIGENAFKNNDQLVEVQAEGVQTIANQAFENCSSLEKVKFGKDLSSIGNKAFNYCGLMDAMAVKAAVPPVVTAQTFQGLGRMSSNAPAKAKAKYAARKAKNATGQKAVSLDVPDDYIAKYLAAQYWNLFSFEYIGEHGGIVRSGQYYDGVWVIYEDGTLIASSETSTGNIDGFYNDATVKRVELMGGATELTWSGFSGSHLANLEEIVLSPALHKLGTEVFKGSTKLKSINLENIDSIGQNCFKGCTSLTSVNLSAVKFIDNNAFEGCNALTDVTISGNGARLRNFLFKDCTGLKRVELNGLDPAYTPSGAFSGCTALEQVKLEGTAMSVGGSMFKDCASLSVVELGSDCRSVGSKAFANTSLDTIFASSPTPATLSADAFENVTLADIHVRVPADYVRIYKKADIWKDMDILADPAYGEPMLPVGGLMNGGNCQWYLETDGTMTFSGEGGCYTTGAAIAQHHQYAIYMENIIYSDEITEIGSDITSQYANYAYVKSVEIGADVKRIYANAMLYPHVTDVYCFAADVPALNASAFNKTALIANDATLHVVDFSGTLAKYQASSSWNWFPHIVADLPTRKAGTIKVTKVIVDPEARNVPLTTDELGSKTIQLTAVVYPANATNQAVTWSTSDASVATVDQNGLVTIVGFDGSGEGITITATAKDGSNKKGTCTMSIWDSSYPDEIPATGIDVNRKSMTLMKSEEGVVRVSLTPANSNAWVDGSYITLSETPAIIDVMPVYDMETGQRTGEFTITPREIGTFEVMFSVRNMDETVYTVSMTVNVVEDVFFTENTKEGVPVTYRLIKTDDRLVEVYGDEEQKITVDPNTGIPSVEYINHTAIDPATTGTITIPSTVRGYNVVGTGEIAFQNCTQLERVDFCPGIQYIGDRAFEGCTSLNEVRLPATLKGLGMNSFAMLTTLKNVHLMAPASPEGLNGMDIWSSSAFMGLWEGENGATLHVAQGCYSVYNVSPWIEWFASVVEDGEAVDNFVASYVCDFTAAASKHSAYGDTWTYDTDWSVFGGANNNGQWAYAKFGGKSTTLANANPVYVANQYAFGREIKAIRVTFPSGSFSKSGMSCNEWGVKVYSDLACTDLLYTVTGEAIAAGGCTLTLAPEAGQVWKAGYGFRVYWNLANTSSTNGIVLVDKIEYLTDAEDSRPVWPMYTVRFLDWNGNVLQEGEIREGFTPAYAGETPVRPMDTEYIYTFTGWDPALVAATADADYTAQYSTEERFPNSGTGIEEISIQPSAVSSQKILHEGMLYIIRPDGAMYDVQGMRVR